LCSDANSHPPCIHDPTCCRITEWPVRPARVQTFRSTHITSDICCLLMFKNDDALQVPCCQQRDHGRRGCHPPQTAQRCQRFVFTAFLSRAHRSCLMQWLFVHTHTHTHTHTRTHTHTHTHTHARSYSSPSPLSPRYLRMRTRGFNKLDDVTPFAGTEFVPGLGWSVIMPPNSDEDGWSYAIMFGPAVEWSGEYVVAQFPFISPHGACWGLSL
jgi:hypothetical protein